MIHRAYHAPHSDPCDRCGLSAASHRVDHEPIGSPCNRCGLAAYSHRVRKNSERVYYVGIDGEGQGREDHRYVMLAWSNESGTIQRRIEAEEGRALETVACLDFILSIPTYAKVFAYAFQYDLSKLLTDVDNDVLYRLFRPELRQRKPGYEMYGPYPEEWQGYQLNMIGSKFTVRRGKRMRVVWDVFRFFQAKFTSALEDWKVGQSDVIERMRLMKDKRAEFDKLSRQQILAYCYDECAYMASLARKLTEAHEAAGLTLKSYYGAGSSASAMLSLMKIDEEVRTGPDEMTEAIGCGFFGGRFEHSVIGTIPGPIWGKDISSAYPYQLTFLPCLGCGKWELTADRRRIDMARASLVHYGLGDPPPNLSWGPFPFRLPTGSIAFPSTSGGGWVWGDEYKEGERLFPHVQFREAWIYNTDCQHRPFAKIPSYYVERLRIGKEGPGIVIKLACNSCYGKAAQSVGANPRFQSWIWAGMITSGTRAQILTILGLHKDRSNMLAVATDGVYSREDIPSPVPRETNTGGIYSEKMTEGPKPLGGWETKRVDKGMFFARPGIYFPTNPTAKEIKAIRARGVGRGVMLENWSKTVEAWETGATLPDRPDKLGVRLANVTRFHGAKSSISRSLNEDRTGFVYRRSPLYGQWETRPVDMSFDPIPKRERVNPDGTLQIREFPRDMESAPYKRSMISEETRALRYALIEALEQPDGDDFSDYELAD